MFVDKAKENIKIQLTNMKRANECGLATKGEFNEDIDAIETILSELETVEQKEKFYKKLSEDNKYYVLELEKKNKQIVYMANFINDNTPYTRDTKELENEQGIRTAKFTQEYFFKKVEDKMEDFKIQKAKFIKLPIDEDGKEILCFGDMLGHEYYIVPAESIKGEYIITGGTYQEAEKLFQKAIYNSLIEIGEDEQFAFAVAYEGEDPGMLLTFRRECFETELDMLTEQIDIGKQNLIRNGNKEEDLILILNTKIYEKDRYKKISNIDVQYAEMPENIKIQIEVRKQEEVD